MLRQGALRVPCPHAVQALCEAVFQTPIFPHVSDHVMLDVTALHVPEEACEGPIIKGDPGVHVFG